MDLRSGKPTVPFVKKPPKTKNKQNINTEVITELEIKPELPSSPTSVSSDSLAELSLAMEYLSVKTDGDEAGTSASSKESKSKFTLPTSAPSEPTHGPVTYDDTDDEDETHSDDDDKGKDKDEFISKQITHTVASVSDSVIAPKPFTGNNATCNGES